MKLKTRSLFLVLASTATSSVLAQNATTADSGAAAQADKPGAQLEEVIVTAQRREGRLQDTPISVTALTATALEARGVRNLSGLDAYTPNLQLNNGLPAGGGSAAAATIRGVGQLDFQFPNDPGVGMYIDGVYLARSLGGLMSVVDVERIEVLRGPQGTLFGRNTIGGAISITTVAPSDEFEGSASLTYGSYDRVEAKGSVNVPLIDGKLAARLTAGYISADGIGEQIPTGLELGNEDRQVVRLAVRGTPSDDFTIDFAADYTRQRQNGGALFFIPNLPSTAGIIEGLFNPVLAPIQNAQFGLPAGSIFDQRWASPDRYDNYGTAPQRDWYDGGGISLTSKWDISDALTLKSITAARALKAEIYTDLDLTPYDIVGTQDHQHDEQYSQELQAYGSLLDSRVDYLLGVYLFREVARSHNTISFFPGTLQIAGFEIGQIADTGLNVTNYAAFGQVGVTIVDGLKFTVGLRQNYERKRFNRQFSHIEGGDAYIPYEVLTADWSSFTPKVGLDWKATEDVLLYASYAEGFKGGGWNPRPTTGADGANPFDPETVKTYEVGAKTQWFDRRLTLNLAGFHSNYSDIQIQTVSGLPDGTQVIETQNSGKAKIYGAELELSARPVPEASIQIGAGYLTNEYTELRPGTAVTLDDKLPDAPRWSVNFGTDYTFTLPIGELTPRIDASYRSTTYKDSINTPQITQPGYWLTNARLAYTPAGADHFELQLYGSNLFDEKYISYGQNLSVNGVVFAGYGRPREWGLTAKYQF